MRRRNTITAAVFLLAVAAGFVLLATSFLGGEGKLEALLKGFARDRDVMAFVDGAETAINQDLDRDHLFIQLYGGVQRLSGRRVVEDAVSENTVAKLSTGALNFVDLQDSAQADEAAVANAAATAAFAQELEHTGTDYVDLRPLFENNGIYANWFFRTDHHWKPEAAFFAWRELAGVLEERYGFYTDPALTNLANWETRVLEGFFLGSQGKRVGSLYAGVDDFTIYTPRFDTDLTYSCPSYGFTRTGPFNQSVCFPERVAEQNWFNGNPYTYYAGGDYPMATIVNHNNQDGPRVLLLRDSFACALTPFLALSCSELITVDLRYYEGDVTELIRAEEPELVLTLYTAGTAGLENLFTYHGTEE